MYNLEGGGAHLAQSCAGQRARERQSGSEGQAAPKRLLDWIDSQSKVTRIWLDELIAEGDPNDMISLIHRQAAWLDLMRSRLAEN